jgi:hypothetical protein
MTDATQTGRGQAARDAQATWDAAWAAALDELELTLEETEQLLRATPAEASAAELVVRPDGTAVAGWVPPQLNAPMPPAMLERAQGLLARQAELIGQTMAAMSSARTNIDLVGRISGTPRTGRTVGAVYLDVRA